MFEKTKQFAKDNAVELIMLGVAISIPAVLSYNNLKLTQQLASTRQYAQAAVRALSAVDQTARNAGVPVEQLNTLIETAGLAVKEAVK